MYSYAIAVGISIVVSLGYSEAYVNCYFCASSNYPSAIASDDCFGPDLTKVRTCVAATCTLYDGPCIGTLAECQANGFRENTTAYVIRGCTNNTIDEDNCAVLKFSLYTETYCVCKGELCNAGPTVKAFPKITFIFMMMSSYAVTLLLQ